MVSTLLEILDSGAAITSFSGGRGYVSTLLEILVCRVRPRACDSEHVSTLLEILGAAPVLGVFRRFQPFLRF